MRWMRQISGIGLVAAALLPACALAQDKADDVAARLAKDGQWQFTSIALKADGEPECRETWTFRKNGSATMLSGDQRTRSRWRVEADPQGTLWLKTVSLSATKGLDCLGKVADPKLFPRPERGLVLQFLSEREALLCQAEGLKSAVGRRELEWGEHRCWGVIASHKLPPDQRVNPWRWVQVAPSQQ